MPRVTSRALAGATAVIVALTACSPDDDGSLADDARPSIVVTTTIWANLVEQLVGEDAVVQVLMDPGQDPHAFAPSARQASALVTADLVVANGLGLEEGLDDLLEQAAAEGVHVLEVAEALDPIAHDEDDGSDGDTDDGHGARDPHVWLDPIRMADAAALLAQAVADVDEQLDDTTWRARGDALAADIRAAHALVEQTLAGIPPDCRKLVTNHDSLSYFAARYDFEVIGTVIPGTSTTAAADAAAFSALADAIEEAGVRAIFTETTESDRLAQALAAEVGSHVRVVALFTGSVAEPDSGADTWSGLMMANATRIAGALSSCGNA